MDWTACFLKQEGNAYSESMFFRKGWWQHRNAHFNLCWIQCYLAKPRVCPCPEYWVGPWCSSVLGIQGPPIFSWYLNHIDELRLVKIKQSWLLLIIKKKSHSCFVGVSSARAQWSELGSIKLSFMQDKQNPFFHFLLSGVAFSHFLDPRDYFSLGESAYCRPRILARPLISLAPFSMACYRLISIPKVYLGCSNMLRE